MPSLFWSRRGRTIAQLMAVSLVLLTAFNNCGEGFSPQVLERTESGSSLEFIVVDSEDGNSETATGGGSEEHSQSEVSPMEPQEPGPRPSPPVAAAKISLTVTGQVLDPGENFEFEVRLSEALSKDLKISYATIDGTAKAKEDYLPAEGELLFAQGETSKKIQVIGLNTRNRDTATAFHLKVAFEYEGQKGIGTVEAKIHGLSYHTPKFIALDDGYPMTARTRSPCGVTTDHQLMCWGRDYDLFFYRALTLASRLPNTVPTPEPVKNLIWLFDVNWVGNTYGLCILSISGATYCHSATTYVSRLVDFGQMPNWVKMEQVPTVQKLEGLLSDGTFCVVDESGQRRCFKPKNDPATGISLSEVTFDPGTSLEFLQGSVGCSLGDGGVAECEDGRLDISGNWREVSTIRFTDDFENVGLQSSVSNDRINNVCFLEDDGTVNCPQYKQMPPVPAEDRFAIIVAGPYDFFCGIHQTDGRVSCWGSYLDLSTQRRVRYAEVSTGLKPIDIVINDFIGCLLNEDKKVYCWATGKYGGGDIKHRPELEGPHALFSQLGAIEKLVHWGSRICALTQGGSVHCVLYNNWGPKPDSSKMVKLSGEGEVYRDLIATVSEVCAIRDTGAVGCWPIVGKNQMKQVSEFQGATRLIANPRAQTKCALFAGDVLKCKGREAHEASDSTYTRYNYATVSRIDIVEHYQLRSNGLFQVRLTKPTHVFVGASGAIGYRTEFGSLRRVGNMLMSQDKRYPVTIPR